MNSCKNPLGMVDEKEERLLRSIAQESQDEHRAAWSFNRISSTRNWVGCRLRITTANCGLQSLSRYLTKIRNLFSRFGHDQYFKEWHPRWYMYCCRNHIIRWTMLRNWRLQRSDTSLGSRRNAEAKEILPYLLAWLGKACSNSLKGRGNAGTQWCDAYLKVVLTPMNGEHHDLGRYCRQKVGYK